MAPKIRWKYSRYSLQEDEEIIGFIMNDNNLQKASFGTELWKCLEKVKTTKPHRTHGALRKRFMRNLKPVLLKNYKELLTYDFVVSFIRQFPEEKNNCNYRELLANLQTSKSACSDISSYRLRYSREEDLEIIKYVRQCDKNNLERLKVANFWKILEASKKTAPKRSFKSLRNRFIHYTKFLLLSEYKNILSEEWKIAFVKLFPEVQSNPSFKKFIKNLKNVQERNERENPVCKACTVVIENINAKQLSSNQVNNSSQLETVVRDSGQENGCAQDEINMGTPRRKNSASSTCQQLNLSESPLIEELPLHRDHPIETPPNQDGFSDSPCVIKQKQSLRECKNSKVESLIRKTRNHPCSFKMPPLSIAEKRITENIPNFPSKKAAENGRITIKMTSEKIDESSKDAVTNFLTSTKTLTDLFVNPAVDDDEFHKKAVALRKEVFKGFVCSYVEEKPETSKSVNSGKRRTLDTHGDFLKAVQQMRIIENLVSNLN